MNDMRESRPAMAGGEQGPRPASMSGGQRSKPYLKQMRIDAFGAIQNRVVGPFDEHLNVVFGENEAGKTTVSAFVTGVMFGWEDARSNRNTYRPERSERAGALVFSDQGEMRELSRVRNVDGLQGDTALVADIDKATFKTMFALNSDELRSLRNAPDVVSRLLTAGSGTEHSPAQVSVALRERIAEYTSRAASVEHSVTQLGELRERLRSELRARGDEEEALRDCDREFRELEPRRDQLKARAQSLGSDIEAHATARAGIARIEEELDERLAEANLLRRERKQALEQREAAEAQLEAFMQKTPDQKPHWGRLASTVVLPIAFALCSLPLFFGGYREGAPLFVAMGACLVAAAVLLGIVGVVSQARWTRADVRERADEEQALRATCEEARRACELLEERLEEAERACEELDVRREDAFARIGLEGTDSLEDVEQAQARLAEEHTLLLEEYQQVNSRYGELKQKLAAAFDSDEFDRMKERYQTVRTRYLDSVRELSRLLLAKHLLDEAIANWDRTSRPEVYQQAGRFLSLMTEGRWTRVLATPTGDLRVGDEFGVERDPLHLSLGTCQQLYLSMRLALLLTAENVGRAMPVLADDILVNFDASRRRAAAQALAELARSRQVILFTCHREVVSALLEADPGARLISL